MSQSDPFLVHDNEQVVGAATHALVIGVGKYPHLDGGASAQKLEGLPGLGQLTSSPESARAFAHWLIERFNNPEKPLSSVALLISEESPRPFKNSKTGIEYTLMPATIDNIQSAFKAWKKRCDRADNMAVFYFCGHGIGGGPLLSLLAEDFGADPENPFDGAVDFHRNHLGMKKCAANQQVYFVDACRTETRMSRTAEGYAGKVFIQPDGNGASKLLPVFYSTLRGLQAYGRSDSPSHFTEALLAALDGTGSDNVEGDWRVNTNSLHRAIDLRMKRIAAEGHATLQIPPVDLMTFDLHWLTEPPTVPVFVCCVPHAAQEHGSLRCHRTGGSLIATQSAASKCWELNLEVGSYDFHVDFPPQAPYKDGVKSNQYINPPQRKVPVEVKS